jgi:SAM-dependent methyltransferase
MKQAISYRDNSGFVIVRERSVLRYVSQSYALQYDALMRSGLYQELVDRDLLIPHREKLLTAGEKTVYYKVIAPELIRCISYPYEWTAAQWKQVALHFLEINRLALKYGMILKDATPFNFSFHNGSCIFFDTLSFDCYHTGEPWIAYRQFCESMLGPLALMKFNHENWGRQLMASIDGWELPFISRNLKHRSYFDLATVLHIHWHSKYRHRNGDRKHKSLSSQKLDMLWYLMYHGIRRWKMPLRRKPWLTYYDVGIGSAAYLADKTEKLSVLLQIIQAGRVIDLGANTGRFSLLASQYSGHVIAVEADHSCVTELQQQIAAQSVTNITTILADVAEPTPATGWNNQERLPLLQRLQGDLVMALALIHHLCIGRNIPMRFVADMIGGMASSYAVVEFVPKADPKVIQMLADREDIFPDYTEDSFVAEFGIHFDLIKSQIIASTSRKLFVWKKK